MSSCCIVVKAEDTKPRGRGFKPPMWRLLGRYQPLGSKRDTKRQMKMTFQIILTSHDCPKIKVDWF
jgi:hypothetical protein